MTTESLQQLIEYLKKLVTPGVEQFIATMAAQVRYDAVISTLVIVVMLLFLVILWLPGKGVLARWYLGLPKEDYHNFDRGDAVPYVVMIFVASFIPFGFAVDNFGRVLNFLMNPDYMIYQRIILFANSLK